MTDLERQSMQKMSRAIAILALIIVALLSFLIYLFSFPESVFAEALRQQPIDEVEPIPICGTASSPLGDSKLFRANCASCHRVTDQRLTGPGLSGVIYRWGGDRERLRGFLLNQDSMLKAGDPYVVALHQEYPAMDYRHDYRPLSAQELETLLSDLSDNF